MYKQEQSTGYGASTLALKCMGRVKVQNKEYQWFHKNGGLSPQKKKKKKKKKF